MALAPDWLDGCRFPRLRSFTKSAPTHLHNVASVIVTTTGSTTRRSSRQKNPGIVISYWCTADTRYVIEKRIVGVVMGTVMVMVVLWFETASHPPSALLNFAPSTSKIQPLLCRNKNKEMDCERVKVI